MGYMERNWEVPVTVQLAPAVNLNYSVALVQCYGEQGNNCDLNRVVQRHTFAGPER